MGIESADNEGTLYYPNQFHRFIFWKSEGNKRSRSLKNKFQSAIRRTSTVAKKWRNNGISDFQENAYQSVFAHRGVREPRVLLPKCLGHGQVQAVSGMRDF